MTTAAGPQAASPGVREYAVVALLALVVGLPSLANGFAYDDRWIIVTNARVHDLGRWAEWFSTSYWPTHEATLYRPLTTAAFALQWAAGDGSPVVFHAVSVVLAAGGAVAFLWLASVVLPARAALIAASLFAVHPVHSEAVSNIVGQSELSAGIVLFAGLALYIQARRRGPLTRRTTLGLAAIYLVGMLIKEHAIMLPAWMLVAEATVLRGVDHGGPRWRAIAPVFVQMFLLAALIIVVRFDVLDAIGGDIPHPAINGLSAAQRALAMLDVLPEIVRVLVWPARLYADYSPEHFHLSTTPDISHLNGAVIVLATVVLLVVTFRRSAPAAMGLVAALLVWLPTANLLMPSGILLAERALYAPSAGVLIAVGVGVAWLDGRVSRMPAASRARVSAVAGGLLACVLVLAIGRFVDRHRAWRSTEDVFFTLVRDAPESFKAHHGWGGVLFDRGDRRGGEREWLMAIRIFPGYHLLYQDLASQYRVMHLCHAALPLYARALEIGGPLPLSRAGTVACQLELARFSEARRTAMLGITDGHDPNWFRARLRTADSALAANDSTFDGARGVAR